MISSSYDVAGHHPTSYDMGHHETVLSDTARAGERGPLRFVVALIVASSLIVGITLSAKGWIVPASKHLMATAETLLPGHGPQASSASLPLSTPTLLGPMNLLSLSPAELMQQYPPESGQSLSDGGFGLPAWQRYRRPAAAMTNTPHIAILVTGLGLNKAITAAAILYLPPDVSLSFSPYAPNLADWIGAARAHGHEALVDLPSQSAAPQDDPGSDGLMTGLRPEENDARLTRITERAPQTIGVTTVLGSRFLTDQVALQPVLAKLASQGLATIDASADNRLQVSVLSAAAQLPHLKAGFAIDETESRDNILRGLSALSVDLQSHPHQLVAATPSPLSLALISGWCKQLAGQGIALTPVSNMLIQ